MDGNGRHAKEGKLVLFKRKKRGTREAKAKLSPRQRALALLRIALALVFCFLMITPIRSCSLARRGYIGESAAQTIAFSSVNVASSSVESVSSDLVRIDGRYCYKVDFTARYAEYSCIIDASSGNIIASSKKGAD